MQCIGYKSLYQEDKSSLLVGRRLRCAWSFRPAFGLGALSQKTKWLLSMNKNQKIANTQYLFLRLSRHNFTKKLIPMA